MKRIIVGFLLFITFIPVLYSQESEPDESTENQPVPYDKEEFPGWVHKIRRAEIILTGSLPISFFAVGLTFDLIRYAQNNFANEYSPGLFGNPESIPLSPDEKKIVLLSTLGISVLITIADIILVEVFPDG